MPGADGRAGKTIVLVAISLERKANTITTAGR
jgi:hypothetical protein